MSQKVDKHFVQFVKSKHRKKHEEYKDGEPQQSQIFSKKKNQLMNYLICDKTAKQNDENEKESIGDWLKENGQKVIVDKYKPNKYQLKTKEESDEDNESESDESDDYEEEKINHFISNKREREESGSEEDEMETIQEMNYLSQKNKEAYKEGEDDDDDNDKEEDEDEDDNVKEDEPKQEMKIKQQQKSKSKKEFQTNISNTVFISNFPKTYTESNIEKCMSKYGDIASVRLIKTKEGESKGFGYIDYESAKGMKTSIAANLQIKGKRIKIEEAKSSFINTTNNINNSTKKRLGNKKQKSLRNKEKEAKRQRHREMMSQKQ